MAGSTKVPNDWNQFLRDSENKDELNKFLAETITAHTFASGKQIFITHQEHVLSNITSVENMVDCSHEEADTRMMIHLEHALSNGAQTIAIDSGDTDVLIIVLGLYHQLRAKYNFIDVILDFSEKRRFSIDTLAQGLGEAKCQALPFFHALTGCNTNSAFKNISKKKVMRLSQNYTLKCRRHLPLSFSIHLEKSLLIQLSSRLSNALWYCCMQKHHNTDW